MSDDFLYRFRAQPSPEFAARLKARLDASATARKRGLRWGVFMLIFGAALAFALPAVRESISRLVGMEAASEHMTMAPESPAVSSARRPDPPAAPTRALEAAPSSALPAAGPPVGPSSSARPASRAWKQDSLMNARGGDFGFVANAPPLPVFESATAGNDPVPHTSTMLDEAHEAILLRRSVFRVMGWATDDLGRRVFDGTSENYDAIAADTARLRELAAMIPEVFELDTRDIGTDTRALPGIWLNPGSFQQEVARLQADLEALEQAARARRPLSIWAGIKAVVASCDSCHDVFRRNDSPRSAQ